MAGLYLSLLPLLPLLATAPLNHPWTPFVSPMPIWDYWYLLLLPLCFVVALVYKAIKTPHLETLPRQALVTTGWILLGMAAAAALLAALVKVLEH